jgi:hypothetical protein
MSGVSLVEALVATLLGFFLVHLGLTTLQRVDRFSTLQSYRHDLVISIRVTRGVLRRELALSGRREDWSVQGDSLTLRAFRGVGIVCAAPVGRAVSVLYRGVREPDPRKDSLEWTSATGAMGIVGLASIRASDAACPVATGGEPVREWTTDRDLGDDVVLIRPFEPGSYHLSGAAFRYRVGAGGRQPLTPEVWNDALTTFQRTDSALRVSLIPTDEPTRGWSGFIVRLPDR